MKALATGLVSLCLSIPFSAYGLNLLGYAQRIVVSNSDDAARTTVLGIADSCGTPTNVDDDCVIRGLERVATEEGNQIAYNMLGTYSSAINEGNFATQPECHVETHLQANRILAHCTLLLNYTALKELSVDRATAQFNMCLQGGLQGLVFQGNIVAQYMLSQFYTQIGLSSPADVWSRAVLIRRNTEEFARLMKCYG